MNPTYEYKSLVWYPEHILIFEAWLNDHFTDWEIIDIGHEAMDDNSRKAVTARRLKVADEDGADEDAPVGVSAMRERADGNE